MKMNPLMRALAGAILLVGCGEAESVVGLLANPDFATNTSGWAVEDPESATLALEYSGCQRRRRLRVGPRHQHQRRAEQRQRDHPVRIVYHGRRQLHFWRQGSVPGGASQDRGVANRASLAGRP